MADNINATYSQEERERIEALASAYVLGVLDENEPDFAEFEVLLEASDPLLGELLEAGFDTTIALSDVAPQFNAPSHIKEALLSKISILETKTDRMVRYDRDKAPLPSSTVSLLRKKNRTIISISLLGGLLVCVLLAVLVVKSDKLERYSGLTKVLMRQSDSLKLSNKEFATDDSLVRCVLNMLQEENARLVTMTTTSQSKHQHVFFSPQQKMVVVMRENLPAIDSNHVYEIWAVVGNTPKPIGSFVVDPHDKEPMYTFSTDLASAEAFGISIEEKGAAPSPKSEMIYIGEVPRFGRN